MGGGVQGAASHGRVRIRGGGGGGQALPTTAGLASFGAGRRRPPSLHPSPHHRPSHSLHHHRRPRRSLHHQRPPLLPPTPPPPVAPSTITTAPRPFLTTPLPPPGLCTADSCWAMTWRSPATGSWVGGWEAREGMGGRRRSTMCMSRSRRWRSRVGAQVWRGVSACIERPRARFDCSRGIRMCGAGLYR